MLKYSIGIDVSAKELHVCIVVIDAVQKVTVKSSTRFANSLSGFKLLQGWILKHHKVKELPLVVTHWRES